MNKQTKIVGGVCFALLAAGCSSSSSVSTPGPDGGSKDTGPHVTKEGGTGTKDTGPGHIEETGAPLDHHAPATDAGDAAHDTSGPHVLISYAGVSPTSTLVAVNLATKAIDGQLTSPDSQIAAVTNGGGANPFLLEQTLDQVVALEGSAPWKAEASWSVDPIADGGDGFTDPVAVAVVSSTQAYVGRFAANQLEIINPSQMLDAAAPTGPVDLSSLVQAGDGDGLVDVSALVYVASSNRLYVVLENIDGYYTNSTSTYTLCGGTKATVAAVDIMTNALVSLGGTGLGGSIELVGYDPVTAVYDATGSRILLFEAGCNPAATTDGGAAGALQQAGIEAVDLTTNTSAMLVSTNDQGYPGSFVYIDSTHAVVGFSYPIYNAFLWDPTMSTLGMQLQSAPNLFDYDGNGNLVGASINYGDGGTATTDIISMALASGTATTLQSNVLTVGTGYIAAVGVWPKP